MPNSDDWLSVGELSQALQVSARSIQLKAKSGEIVSRNKDKKSIEISISSLPAKWLDKLGIKPNALTQYFAPKEKTELALTTNTKKALGRPLSERERRRIEVYDYYKSLSANISEAKRCEATAMMFSLSESTVRRYVTDITKNGVVGAKRNDKRRSKWDEEALKYMQAYYLQLLKVRNIDSKQAAWQAVVAKAEEMGWSIGGRSSAFTYLKNIPSIVMDYTRGGNRALDNHFYIKRDWSSLHPAQILIGDQHIADFWVYKIENGKVRYIRPTFYVWEDAATRCIAGLSVDEDYDSETVLQALEMAIRRFGFFDCTYNDNGTSECSTIAKRVIDDLIILSNGKCRMMDISDLYKTEDGSYAVEDENEHVLEIVKTRTEWKRKHRRIYANVKNAKTKPIERLFSTLEDILAQQGCPGRVVTPGCPASQEEKESQVLAYQKAHGMILTLDEFVWRFVDAIEFYETKRKHGSLGCTPIQKLMEWHQKGWKALIPAEQELKFIFMRRKAVQIKKSRVTVDGYEFIGEDIRSENGVLLDVGLTLHEGEKVEVRYNIEDTSKAYAVLPNAENMIRPLKAVDAITMLDDELMEEKIKWKRHCMKIVREASKELMAPDTVFSHSKISERIEDANANVKLIEEKIDTQTVQEMLAPPSEKPKEMPFLQMHASAYDRFKWCLDMVAANQPLTQKDKRFMQDFKLSDEYSENEVYWNTYEKFGGIK